MVKASVIPQLFLRFDGDNHVAFVVINIVDDIFSMVTKHVLRSFVLDFGQKVTLGERTLGPGRLGFFGHNIVQHEDFSCSIDGYGKLNALEPYPLSRLRRRQCEEKMNAIEENAFISINASIGWLGMTSSVLCAFYSIDLLNPPKVSALMSQVSALNLLKRFGTLTTYVRPRATNYKERLLT